MSAPPTTIPSRVLDESRINLVLAGFPKCGTTALADWLGAFSDIAVSVPKETFQLVPEFERSAPVPLSGMFPSGASARIRAEATTLNIYSDDVRLAIREREHIRVIVIIREPEKALPSWHNQVVNAGLNGGKSLSELWDAAASQELPLVCDYPRVMSYGSHIERWLEALGHERMLILRTGDLHEPSAAAGPLTRFLGVTSLPSRPAVLNGAHTVKHAAVYHSLRGSFAMRSILALEKRIPAVRPVMRRGKSLFFVASAPPGRDEVREDILAALAPEYATALRLQSENRDYWNAPRS
jgi:hypothetical protein